MCNSRESSQAPRLRLSALTPLPAPPAAASNSPSSYGTMLFGWCHIAPSTLPSDPRQLLGHNRTCQVLLGAWPLRGSMVNSLCTSSPEPLGSVSCRLGFMVDFSRGPGGRLAVGPTCGPSSLQNSENWKSPALVKAKVFLFVLQGQIRGGHIRWLYNRGRCCGGGLWDLNLSMC
jgi:hypothetical protein